jgi:hypothetical protein
MSLIYGTGNQMPKPELTKEALTKEQLNLRGYSASRVPPLPPRTTPVSAVRTFSTDVQVARAENKITLTSIAEANAQVDRQEHAVKKLSALRVLVYIIGSVSFVLLGIIPYHYYQKSQEQKENSFTPTTLATSRLPEIITTSNQIQTVGSETNSVTLLNAFYTRTPRDLNQVDTLHIMSATGGKYSAEKFLQTLSSDTPAALIRNVTDFYGSTAQTEEGGEHVQYLVLTVNSYDVSFPAFLAWEPYLTEDVVSVFYSPSSDVRTPTLVFEDKVVLNKDVRVLYDTEGQVLLTYTFITPKQVVITPNLESLRFLLERLQS